MGSGGRVQVFGAMLQLEPQKVEPQPACKGTESSQLQLGFVLGI